MAYGYSRGRRDYEPDPRDIIEDAARAAGLSVGEWLERNAARNAYADDEVAPRGSRRRYRPVREEFSESPLDSLSRRYGRRAASDEVYSEDRVARILDEAMDAMQETIRANEAKTASVLAALGEQVEKQTRATALAETSQTTNSVRQMVSDIQRGMNQPATLVDADASGRSTIDLLEQRITNVVSLLEKKAHNPDQETLPEQFQPKVHLEREVAALGERLDHLSKHLTTHLSAQAKQAPKQDLSQHLSKLHQEIARLGKIAQSGSGGSDVMSALEAINAKIGQLEKSSSHPQNTDRVAQEIAALRAGLDAARETLSPDLAAIDQRFERLGQQFSQVVDRIGTIDRTPAAAPSLDRFAEEIASLRAGLNMARMQSEPDLSGIERRFEALSGRIDLLADKISSIRPNGPRDMRGQRSFDTAISELKALMERNKAPANDGRILDAVQSLEQRLDAAMRASSQRETGSGAASLDLQFGSLKSRLDDIADKIAERRNNEELGVGSISQIGQAIEDLKRMIQTSARGSDDTRVIQAFQAIERRMEALERQPAELVARVDQLHAALSGQVPSIAHVSPDTESLLRKLATQIDQMQSGSGDDRAFEKLHQDVRLITERLNSVSTGGDARGLPDIGQLERSVSMLVGELEGLKSGISSATEQAARRAASDVLKQVPSAGSGQSLAENLQVQRQLSDIHVAQQEAEKRTSETLGAVHVALTQVVSRLVEMEKDMVKRQDAPLPQDRFAQQDRLAQQPAQQVRSAAPETIAPQMPPAPLGQSTAVPPSPLSMQLQEAMAEVAAAPQRGNRANPLPQFGSEPPLSTPLQVQSPDTMAMQTATDNAFASTVASVRAQKLGVSPPTLSSAPVASPNPIAGALASAKGMLAGLRGGKGKADGASPTQGDGLPSSMTDALTAPVAAAPSQPKPSSFDMPLEPGSGRPRPGAAAKPGLSADPNDPKANFLAAARRAAQVAADQSADAMTQGAAAAKGAAAAGKAGLKKKHALLLGLAALIVAVGATLTFMKDAPAPKKELAAPASTIAPANRDAAARRQELPQQTASAPRQILPQPAEQMPPLTPMKAEERSQSISPTARNLPASSGVQQPDMGTVGSIASDANRSAVSSLPPPVVALPRVPSAANDQLMRFEGINGSDRLKEAARNGDTSAFIEFGNRYLEGKGAPRDPKTAALWFERAADFGSAPAQYRLGALYREGKGVERNAKVALKHFQAAAEAGNARAMHNTAVLLAEGANGGPDYAGATEWFKKAAEFGIRDSQYNLAILYARGLGISQDLMASFAWFAAAAASGDEDAGKKRDEVGARLTPERLQQAKAAAQSWKAKTPDPAANEVAAPNGGWDSSAKQVPNAAKPPKRS